MKLWELESNNPIPETETAITAKLAIMNSALQTQVTKHQTDEPFDRTNIEAFVIFNRLLPATQPLITNGEHGRTTNSVKEKQARFTGKLELSSIILPISHKGSRINFLLPTVGVKPKWNLHTAVKKCTEAICVPCQSTRDHSMDNTEASMIEIEEVKSITCIDSSRDTPDSSEVRRRYLVVVDKVRERRDSASLKRQETAAQGCLRRWSDTVVRDSVRRWSEMAV
ncbi:hypothetical protein N665_0498s0041 [Sinapis alba]|nr:hypothetical protein N665_0498s0041 [Sinapis alba]